VRERLQLVPVLSCFCTSRFCHMQLSRLNSLDSSRCRLGFMVLAEIFPICALSIWRGPSLVPFRRKCTFCFVASGRIMSGALFPRLFRRLPPSSHMLSRCPRGFIVPAGIFPICAPSILKGVSLGPFRRNCTFCL
jgi:hypothetical protein